MVQSILSFISFALPCLVCLSACLFACLFVCVFFCLTLCVLFCLCLCRCLFLPSPIPLRYSDDRLQEEESGIKSVADDYNFIAVFPQGLDDTVVPNQQAFSWNSVGTVGSPVRRPKTLLFTQKAPFLGGEEDLKGKKGWGKQQMNDEEGTEISLI